MTCSRRALIAAALALPIAARAGAQGPAVEIVRSSPRLDTILPRDAGVELLGSGYRWTEGPVWVPGRNWLLFSDVPQNRIWRWRRGRGVDLFLSPSGLAGAVPPSIREAGANGLALDSQGRLLMADSGSRTLARFDLATRKKTVLASRYAGKRFNSPNDMAVARDGSVYFTDPPYGLTDDDRSPLREQKINGVYRRMADGSVRLIDGEHRRPNGIGLSPDGATLYVQLSDEARPELLAYRLDRGGMPTGVSRLFDYRADLASGGPGLPDGMEVGAKGNLFVSGPGGLHILAPDGERLGIVRLGRAISNCAIGEGGRSLFLTASDSVVRLPLLPGA